MNILNHLIQVKKVPVFEVNRDRTESKISVNEKMLEEVNEIYPSCIDEIHILMVLNALLARELKFLNFYKLYFPLTYNPEIGSKASVGEPDSHLTMSSSPFYLFRKLYFKFVP